MRPSLISPSSLSPPLICFAVPQTYTESEPVSPKDLTTNDSQPLSQSQDDDESCLASPIALEDLALSDPRRPSRDFASPGALDASQSRRTVECYEDDYQEDVTAALLEDSRPIAIPGSGAHPYEVANDCEEMEDYQTEDCHGSEDYLGLEDCQLMEDCHEEDCQESETGTPRASDVADSRRSSSESCRRPSRCYEDPGPASPRDTAVDDSCGPSHMHEDLEPSPREWSPSNRCRTSQVVSRASASGPLRAKRQTLPSVPWVADGDGAKVGGFWEGIMCPPPRLKSILQNWNSF